MKILFVIFLLFISAVLFAIPKYGLGQWEENGHGNHRAVVKVTDTSDYNYLYLEWRRLDKAPEKKAIIIENEKGEEITDFKVVSIDSYATEIVFKPKEAGLYYFYYLPFKPVKGWRDGMPSYRQFEDTSSDSLKSLLNFSTPLTPLYNLRGASNGESAVSGGNESEYRKNIIDKFPKAELVEIQARKYDEELNPTFHSFYPMEVVALPQEVQALKDKNPLPYLLFTEDRYHPIKMETNIPYHWAKEGPKTSFQGTAQPNEYYVFQVGVFAVKDIEKINVKFGDLKLSTPLTPRYAVRGESDSGSAVEGESGNETVAVGEGNASIPAENLTCFNLGGIDYLGMPFTKEIGVKKDTVQALWFGVSVPQDAKGLYKGQLEICGDDICQKVDISLNVEGDYLADRGDSDMFRLSRLRWLNEATYIDDTVPHPYTPIDYEKNGYNILDREIKFNNFGLLKNYTSRDIQILSGDMEFNLISNGKKLNLSPVPDKEAFAYDKGFLVGWRKKGDSKGVYSKILKSDEAIEIIKANCEFDGCINYSVKILPLKDISLDDITLNIPLKKSAAKYMMGLGKQGGNCPLYWNWQWNPVRPDHQLWIGDVDAGINLELMDKENYFHYWDFVVSGLPESWDNNGQGGINIETKGSTTLVKAYCGKRELKKHEEIEFNFRLCLTPFHKPTPDRFDYRYGGSNYTRWTQWHGRRYTEYINYPIYNMEGVKEVFKEKSLNASYPVKIIDGKYLNPKKGTIHFDLTAKFDDDILKKTGKPHYDYNLLNVVSESGYYLKCHLYKLETYTNFAFTYGKDEPGKIAFVNSGCQVKHGERHTVSYVYGDQLKVFLDGKQIGTGEAKDHLNMVKMIELSGPWEIHQVQFEDTDTYNGEPVNWGKIGTYYNGDLNLDGKEIPHLDAMYFTTRELTNNLPEFFALKSLGHEIFTTDYKKIDYPANVDSPQTHYPWIQEHTEGYLVPGWYMETGNGSVDSAVYDYQLSRWHNFYINAVDYLLKNVPECKGIYIDGMSQDREVMKRLARVLQKYRGDDYFLQIHCANQFPQNGLQFNSTNINVEMFAYGTDLWLGEFYFYDMAPSNWLTETSGLTFGVPSIQLNFVYPYIDFTVFPYRSHLYGTTEANGDNAKCFWDVWREFGIKDAEMLGYWDKKCPVSVSVKEFNNKVERDKSVTVHTGVDGTIGKHSNLGINLGVDINPLSKGKMPEFNLVKQNGLDMNPILATAFVKKSEKTLITLASWKQTDEVVKLNIDWKALGLDKNKVKVSAPFIADCQEAQTDLDLDNLKIPANQGLLIWVE